MSLFLKTCAPSSRLYPLDVYVDHLLLFCIDYHGGNFVPVQFTITNRDLQDRDGLEVEIMTQVRSAFKMDPVDR